MNIQWKIVLINGCEPNYQENICQEQIDCSDNFEEIQCNNWNYTSKPCHWVVHNNKQFCTQYKCSSVQQSQSCSGTRIGSEFCVEISDSVCLSCEEISDSCDCLQQSKYCSYDIVKDKCISKSCESYLAQEECPPIYCTFMNEKCQISCEFIYKEELCQQIDKCEWIEAKKKCQIECSNIQEEQQCSQVQLCFWDQYKQNCQIKQNINIVVEIYIYGEIIAGLIILSLIFV
ncbi:unnamed protein product (macronuclear) [Paramecium tetraurelia]|uniref:Transmembrane protein n=1 Tax=Paramecium tetraurelia TaxID=5888 RepID=A0C4M1_PARTE|nr:uncharacterized protein GSPATT00006237001 [Paramecium tetraurelia]CAK65738.1 unnamed protein product [Paramecium tetraurelia]|eukprot:XP_001433135.1 hypothetical protein (macronuclear) [Paramecium tetraurelia strain d4-2]